MKMTVLAISLTVHIERDLSNGVQDRILNETYGDFRAMPIAQEECLFGTVHNGILGTRFNSVPNLDDEGLRR